MTIFNGGATIFILAPGAFFVLAMLVALQNRVKMKKRSCSRLRKHVTRVSVQAAAIICVQVKESAEKGGTQVMRTLLMIAVGSALVKIT